MTRSHVISSYLPVPAAMTRKSILNATTMNGHFHSLQQYSTQQTHFKPSTYDLAIPISVQERYTTESTQPRVSTMSRRALMSVPRALSTISRPSLARTAAPFLRSAAAQPQRRSYHEKVLDHYSNPRNVGSMDKSLADVGTGKSEPSVLKTKLARSQS